MHDHGLAEVKFGGLSGQRSEMPEAISGCKSGITPEDTGQNGVRRTRIGRTDVEHVVENLRRRDASAGVLKIIEDSLLHSHPRLFGNIDSNGTARNACP
jgi:hypothetical protein